MTTTRVLATALPHTLGDGPHLTAFVTLKLDPGGADGTLADFPAAADWPTTLAAGRWELLTDSVADPLPLTAAAGADPGAWTACLPPTTRVAGFPAPTVSAAPWTSFPASRLPDHALGLHLATLTAAPTTRPGVLTNPAATGFLQHLSAGWRSLGQLSELAAQRATRADRLLARRLEEATASTTPAKAPNPRVHEKLGYRTSVDSQASALEVLFDDDGADERLTERLDAQLGKDLSGDPEAQLLVDAHAARRYYDRPEEQTQYQREPTPGARLARPERPDPDFHARCASFGGTPVLLRRLGLAVDLTLADDDRAKLANATWVAVRFVPADDAEVTRVAPPRTRVLVAGQTFEATSSDDWVHGAVPLGRAGYVLLDLDPDASGLKLDQHLRDLPRQVAAEVNGDEATSAPATLRSSGFAVARTDRVAALRARTAAAESRAADDDDPGVVGPTLQYDDLVRGLRLEVWDDHSRAWHSLHECLVSVIADAGPVLIDAPDTGFLQGSSLNRVPGGSTYYAHEVLAGWDGWSLSAPRPGRVIVHAEDGSEQVVDEPPDEPATGVRITTRVARGTLPRLRWGWQYAFRLVGVDLAGGAVPRPSASPSRRPGARDAALDAARRHLRDVAAAYAERDERSLLAAVRDQVLAALPAPADDWGTVSTPPPGPRTRAQKIATYLPQALRTGDDDVDAAAADRIAAASAARVASPTATAFDQVSAAMRTLAQADRWRVRPTAPPDLVADLAGADDPVVVTLPRPYLRWAPVPPPALVATAPLTTGEQLSRLVLRTGLSDGHPDAGTSTARHVVPPKTTQLDAETAGKFDAAIGTGDDAAVKARYAIALAERGTLLDEVIPSLDDAHATRTQPGIALAARPGSDPAAAVTLAQITAQRDTPLGEGQYVLHATDDLVLPYLPDPHAAGVALVFYDAGAPHSGDRRPLQAVVLPFGGDWPRLEPLRLVLTGGPTLGARRDGRVIRVTLPAGEQVRVALSSSLRRADLDDFGLWRSQLASTIDPDGDGTASPEQVVAAAVLMRAAEAGWTWWLTPSVDLRLVHAVPAPVEPPQLLILKPSPRPAGLTVAPLVGFAQVHGASTERLVVRGAWAEWQDDLASPGPVQVARQDVLVSSPVGGAQRWGLLTLVDFQPFGGGAATASLADGDLGMHRAIATFPDTHHRLITYTPSGTTRYAEFFAPADLPEPTDPALAGSPVVVDIPSSARPAAAEVADTVPLLRWETGTEPEQPFALRRVRRSGVRVWLRRPWFSSGDGELLGVVVGADLPGQTSSWGRDPIGDSPTVTTGGAPPLLEAVHLVAQALTGALAPRTARPVTLGVPLPLVDAPGTPTGLVFGYLPEFHVERGQWFVDIAVEDTPQLWPFLRLAVARYQPSSITGAHLSPVTTTSWVQPLPTRTATVSRPDTDHVRVTLTGTVTGLRGGPRGHVVPSGDLDADTPTGVLATADAFVTATRTVQLSVQHLADGASDLQWSTVATRRLPVVGYAWDARRVTWAGTLPLPAGHGIPLATPGSSSSGRWRVLVEEAELLDADAPGVANIAGETVTVPRTVYADTVML